MLATAIQKEKRRVFNEGKREGIQEQTRNVARKMIANGLAPDVIMEITGVSRSELVELNCPLKANQRLR